MAQQLIGGSRLQQATSASLINQNFTDLYTNKVSTTAVPALLASLGVAQKPTTVTTAASNVQNDPSLYYKMNSSSAQTITLPSGLSQWTEGMILNIIQLGSGLVTIAAGSGVTILKSSSTLNSKGQYNIIQLLNVGVDNWMIVGGTA